jgi:PPP family 3-phenylpropionic acid transporter
MKSNLTFRYSLHQFAYWAASAGIISFATTFLLEKGFPSSRVGLLMACASLLSGVTQPTLAAVADRAKRCILSPLIVALTSICALCFALLLLDGLPAGVFALLYLCGVWSFDAMIPLLNSLHVHYTGQGYRINYGLSRAVGSLSYSLSALALGYVIQSLGPNWMVRAILLLLPICILITLSYPKGRNKAIDEPARPSRSEEVSSLGEFFCRYRWYCISLLGVLLLAMFHAMTENYLIAIMGRLGGDSRHVGVALFVATVTESGVLVFFDQIRRRISDHWLLRYAAFSFLLKSVLLLIAPSIPFIYAVQLLQMTSYTFLSPVQVFYASEKVAPADMVKGQAFITASYTLGCAMGNLTGGVLMEHFGVVAILIAGVIIAALGTVVLLLTVDRQDAYRLAHP